MLWRRITPTGGKSESGRNEAFDIYIAEADGKRILCNRTVGTSVDIFVIALR